MRTVGASEPRAPLKKRLNNPLSRASAFSACLRSRRRHVILRKTKLTPGSRSAQHGRASIEPGVCRLVQQQDARKNYIGLVNDTAAEESLAGNSARARPRVVSYLAGRLAAVLKRTGKAAPERPISP
jgi:hypothetical protein